VKKTVEISRVIETLSAVSLAAGFAAIQVLIGGTRLLFSLPAYGLVAISGLLSLFLLRRPKPAPAQICLVSTALFFSYILARALFSPVAYIARADIYSVLGGLVVYFFIACILTAAKPRMLLLLFLLAVAMVHVVVGAIQFRYGENFMLIPFLQRHDYGRRASGFYVCPNHLAGLLEVIGAFGWSIVCWSRWPAWMKLLTGYAAGVCYLGLILTGSRGGYLSAVASLLILAILSMIILRQTSARLFWRVAGAGLIGTLVIGITIFFLVHKSAYLSDRAQNVVDTANIRIDLWQAAIQQWKLQPIFGTGSGTYLYYGRQFRTERTLPDPVYVHNDYLQLLAEYGLVGVAGFLVFFAAHLRNGWKNLERLGPKRAAIPSRLLSNSLALNVGAIAAVSAYVVHSVFDFNLHIPANVLLLALVFGILANSGPPHRAEAGCPTIRLVGWRLISPALGLIILIQCARLLPGEYFTEKARTSLRDDDPPSAALYAQRGLESEHNNPYLYQYLGSAFFEEGDDLMTDPPARTSSYKAAITAFEQAQVLAPQDKTFPLALGSLYDLLGRFDEAEWIFDKALALDPKSIPTRQCYDAHLKRWKTSDTSSGPIFPDVSEPNS
jgi:O-antigen ligase